MCKLGQTRIDHPVVLGAEETPQSCSDLYPPLDDSFVPDVKEEGHVLPHPSRSNQPQLKGPQV